MKSTKKKQPVKSTKVKEEKEVLPPPFCVELTVEELGTYGAISCGFRMNFIEGTKGEEKFSLDCGAGLGSPWLVFNYKGRWYRMDARELVGSLIKKLDGE